ncbi:MAG: electron transfer flavoprotein subunit alpha/FixB family protein, partial [Burkholderiaceae bacterium]|nr:electron transfer flavoprotein subunit alpha/FixB family protein [Burkholderiaceae bacterium]
MAALVLAEHDQHSLKMATHHSVSAAKQCTNEVDVLLVGHDIDAIAQEASKIEGVRKVIYANAP